MLDSAMQIGKLLAVSKGPRVLLTFLFKHQTCHCMTLTPAENASHLSPATIKCPTLIVTRTTLSQ